MKITYIAHSGFSVELEEHVLLFDYFTGTIPEWEKEKKVLVFASHRHQDHFNPAIFDLAEKYPAIHYCFGNDIRLNEGWFLKKKRDPSVLSLVTRIKPGTGRLCAAALEWEGVRVWALKSTDEGVAFVVEAEGRLLYHAGDLNWWHWEGEPLAWNRNMEVNYKREIDRLEGLHFDAAFVPLDPRLGEAFGLGMDYFLQKAEADCVFPMHMWEEYDYIDRYRETEIGKPHADRIRRIRDRGEVFWEPPM